MHTHLLACRAQCRTREMCTDKRLVCSEPNRHRMQQHTHTHTQAKRCVVVVSHLQYYVYCVAMNVVLLYRTEYANYAPLDRSTCIHNILMNVGPRRRWRHHRQRPFCGCHASLPPRICKTYGIVYKYTRLLLNDNTREILSRLSFRRRIMRKRPCQNGGKLSAYLL